MKKFIFAAALGLALVAIPTLVQAAPPGFHGNRGGVNGFSQLAPVNSYNYIAPMAYQRVYNQMNGFGYGNPGIGYNSWGVTATPWGYSAYGTNVRPGGAWGYPAASGFWSNSFATAWGGVGGSYGAFGWGW